MKIQLTARGYEAVASLPQVSGTPANPPPDDGSGEAFAVWDKVGKQVLVYDKTSTTWGPAVPAVGGVTAWKDAVQVATTANGTLATAYIAGQTVDGVVLVLGWRILLKNQTAGAENGIYVVTAGVATRATDMNTGIEFPGAAVVVQQGTANADTAWICTNMTAPTVETTAITFAAFGAGLTDGVTLQGDGSSGNKYALKAASTSGSISGNGTAGSPILSTKLNAILNLARGADIPDADTTINPGTDKASEYHVPGPLTANRVLTIANSGSPLASQQVVIVNYDTSAFTLTVKNATTATIFTFAANPGVGVIRWELCYWPGTNFTHNLSGYAQAS